MRIVRPRCANASLAPTPTTTGSRSRRATAATREARAEVAPRPSASAACTGIRPARQAGSAVASATTASAIEQRDHEQRRARRRVGGRAERVGRARRQPLRHEGAAREPERRGERRQHEVVRDEQAGDAERRQPDRPQQADLAPLGEHAAADRGGEREGRGEQGEQRRRLQDRQQPPRVIGPVGPLRPPVERAHGALGRRARGAQGERLRRRRVGEAHADAELQRLVLRGQPEHVGRVGPAVARSRGRADADHAQLTLRRADAGRERVADRDAVPAREPALQDDFARRARGAAVEDQRALDARLRARKADQPERVALGRRSGRARGRAGADRRRPQRRAAPRCGPGPRATARSRSRGRRGSR